MISRVVQKIKLSKCLGPRAENDSYRLPDKNFVWNRLDPRWFRGSSRAMKSKTYQNSNADISARKGLNSLIVCTFRRYWKTLWIRLKKLVQMILLSIRTTRLKIALFLSKVVLLQSSGTMNESSICTNFLKRIQRAIQYLRNEQTTNKFHAFLIEISAFEFWYVFDLIALEEPLNHLGSSWSHTKFLSGIR